MIACHTIGCERRVQWWRLERGKWVGHCGAHRPVADVWQSADGVVCGQTSIPVVSNAWEGARLVRNVERMGAAIDAARAFLDTLQGHGGDAAAADVVRAEVVLRDALAALGGDS